MKRHDPLLERTLALRRQREERERKAHLSAPRQRSELRKKKLWGLHDELDFGRHRGRTIEYVIEADRDWLVWALECIPTFDLAPDAQSEFEASADPRRPPRAWE